MVKASLNTLMPVYENLFNSYPRYHASDLMRWSYYASIIRAGVITRQISEVCLSPAPGKNVLFDILKQRLLKNVMSLNTLHN